MDTLLTFRQQRFIFEYLKDQNASAAAARAGYTAKNMAAQGNELMSNPAVRERVRMEMQSLLAEIRCSALELMKQRMRAAFFDAGKMLRGWEPIAPEEMDEETRRAVEVVTVLRKNGPEVRVKQPDRHKALRALDKVHERLDQLNEKHYARLERAGEVLSLEEIERRADAEEAASDISEKPQVLSGSEPTPESSPRGACPALGAVLRSSPKGTSSGASTGSGRTGVGCEISGKPMVLSGSEVEMPEKRGIAFPENPQVLSGCAPEPFSMEPLLPANHTGCPEEYQDLLLWSMARLAETRAAGVAGA